MAPKPALWNIRVAQRHGILTAGYVSLSPRRAWSQALETLDRVYGGFYPGAIPRTLFVDVELDGLRPEHVLEAARSLEARGFRVGVYTRESFWRQSLGNPRDPEFARYPLWDALWNGIPELPDSVDYGPPGWRVVGRQYSGGTLVPGLGVRADLDVFDLSFFL